MSSAADIVKRLQSLQKCLSELQSQNKILKDLNHSLAAEKSELLEKIAVLEASQSKTSTEAKADTKSSDIVESVLPQKVVINLLISFVLSMKYFLKKKCSFVGA